MIYEGTDRMWIEVVDITRISCVQCGDIHTSWATTIPKHRVEDIVSQHWFYEHGAEAGSPLKVKED